MVSSYEVVIEAIEINRDIEEPIGEIRKQMYAPGDSDKIDLLIT